MGKFDGVLDEVYGKQNTKLTSVLDEIYGPAVEPVTMVENEPTPIADMMVGLNRGIESAGEAITSPIQKLFTAPPNQDVVVPEELDMSSMQAVRDRQAMLPPSMPAEPGYVPPAGITEGLEAAWPIAYQATKKGISGAVQALAENAPVTSFPTAPIAEYMQGVGEGAQAEIEKTIQEKQIRPGTISGVATDVGATVLQFAPILGASIISPALAPYGLGLLATISGGDKYQKAKQAGFTEEQALAQGIAYGVAEVVGEKIGLDALLSAYKNPAVRQSVTGFIKQVAKQAGIGAGEEGVTQIMQNATDITAKKVNPYTAGEAPAITQDVLYSAGVGAIGQGIIGGGMGALQSMMGGKQQTQPQEEQAPPPPESPTATEPPPQNMEATTEFLTRKPAVTFGETERLRGEEVPTGGMTINRQARPTVTFGGEGERTGEAIPEGKGMTIQPTAPTNKLDQLFKREPSKTSPQPQQATEVAPKGIDTQPAEPTAVKTPETDIKNFYKYNEESQNNIMSAQQFESASIERSDGNPAIKTIIYRWEPKPNGNGGKLLKDVFLDNKKESSEIYNEYENKIDAVKDAYNNISTNRSDRKSFFIDKDVKKYDTEVQNTKTKNERRAKITEQVQSEVDNKVQEIEQIKNDLNTKYHTELAREYKAAGILFEKVKPSKYRKTFKGQIQPIVTKENQKQIKEISSRIMDKIKKENKVAFDEITNFKADDYKNKLIEERTALSEGKPVPPEVLAEYPDLQPRPKSGPGMFGGTTLQNAYEKVEPTLKKGADMLFKKGKQAYETVKRNADLTRDMGRVVDITEKEGRPVETEPPIRPRIGMFGAGTIQDIYEKIVGKKQTSNEKITIGDPNIAKKIDDAYDATDKIEMDTKKDAEKMRQTVGGAARQSMIDLFAPYLDLVKKDPARYEQALKKLHDVFYIPSEVEGFLNDYRDQILAPIKKAGKTYRDYSAYRMAKWTLTGRAKVKSKLTLPEAQQFIDSVDPQTRKLFEDITTNFHEKTWKPLLKLLEDSGLKDDKVINFIMDKENYSPFFPAKQMGLSYGSREYKPSGEIFKLTEKGYEGDIQDVLTSLMQKGIAMLTHANINMAKLEGIDILKTMAPKSITKAKQSFKGVKKLKDSNGNEIEVPIMEFDEPSSTSNMELITVRKDGKAEGYYVPKQFAEAFDNALGDPASFADALRYFSQLTQTIKNVWIDYNPPWQVFVNAMRDIPAAAIEMPGFKKPVKFLGKVIKKAPAAVGDYIPFFGDVLQQITGYDRAQFDKQVTQMLKDKKLLSSKDVQHLGDYEITVFDRIQNAFDSFPKDGESQSFLQGMKAFGKDIERLTKVAFDETLEESGEYAPDEIVNMTRRGGSPAFVVRGGGVLNSAIKIPLMFYNAMKEGWRAGKYFYQKDPVGFTIKASVPLGIFAFGAAAAVGAFGDEWKKAYLAIKKSDRENKLTFPLWWKDNGNIKYMAISVPQFLKPFMMIINEFASSNPSLADGFADALSNEMPSLNPILDIGKSLLAYGSNKPPVDRFGNPIMTQDQWTAGGSEKAIAMLKSISNQNLFGSYFKFPIKPSDKRKDWLETFYDASFGKIMKESYAPAIDTEQEDVNAAKARLLARQIIEIEKENPEEANRLRDEMRKLGYTPSRQFMRSIRRETNIEREKEAGTITDREAYEKRLRQQPKTKRKKYNELFKK